MKLIANRQLCFGNNVVEGGEEFEMPDDVAADLMRREVARRAEPPKILYETKPARMETPTIQPESPEVTARQPFRNVPVLDEEPQAVAPAGDPVLPESDIHEQRTADPSGRRKRARFGSGR